MQINKRGKLLEQNILSLGVTIVLQREFLLPNCQHISFEDIRLLHFDPMLNMEAYASNIDFFNFKNFGQFENLVELIDLADVVLFVENIDGVNECKVLKNRYGQKGFIQ